MTDSVPAQPARARPDGWTVVFDGWDPADEGRREALCTLGNGYLATRGAAAESHRRRRALSRDLRGGLLQPASTTRSGAGTVETESLVNLPELAAAAVRSR